MCLGGAGAEAAASANRPASRVRRVTRVRDHDGRVDWSHRHNRVAFDMRGQKGVYDVYTMNPDGSDVVCLTCDTSKGAPSGHNGNPAWHPSGDYVVFQAERTGVGSRRSGLAETPGNGKNNELRLATRDGQRFYRLTWPGSEKSEGVLHPHFSADGSRLSWSEMVGKVKLLRRGGMFGYWKLRVADFEMEAAGPRLSNVREYEPGGAAFYENHGFSPDGERLIFTSNMDHLRSRALRADIYSLDLRSGRTTRLTKEGYNEHAGYTAKGKIVWMSTADRSGRGTDYWTMDADGSNKTRLTHFDDPSYPEYAGEKVTAADWTESPDGRRILALLLTALVKHQGRIVMIELADD
jgi:Tol biopolymer transport system component